MNPATVFLTLDVEPDYGRAQTCRVLDQADSFWDWLRQAAVPMTAFIAGKLIHEGHPVLDRLTALNVPLALHGYTHAPETFGNMRTSHAGEIQAAHEAFLRRMGRRPNGYRAAAGIISDKDVLLLDRLGFRYDTSIFPLRRAGRYDFSRLPRLPFCWAGTSLIEIPFGLLTRRMPAGMTFINLLGAKLSTRLMLRRIGVRSVGQDSAGWYVVDLHLHNLFIYTPALEAVPLLMRMLYKVGAWRGGLPCLTRLIDNLLRAGVHFGNLEEEALRMRCELLPQASLDVFGRKP